jgi:SNF2 family DNA or RNA helicase
MAKLALLTVITSLTVKHNFTVVLNLLMDLLFFLMACNVGIQVMAAHLHRHSFLVTIPIAWKLNVHISSYQLNSGSCDINYMGSLLYSIFYFNSKQFLVCRWIIKYEMWFIAGEGSGKVSLSALSAITTLKKLCSHPDLVFEKVEAGVDGFEGVLSLLPEKYNTR